eukprot:3170012-Amphidinium_carterae.1
MLPTGEKQQGAFYIEREEYHEFINDTHYLSEISLYASVPHLASFRKPTTTHHVASFGHLGLLHHFCVCGPSPQHAIAILPSVPPVHVMAPVRSTTCCLQLSVVIHWQLLFHAAPEGT